MPENDSVGSKAFAPLATLLTAAVQLVAAFFAVNNRFFDAIQPPTSDPTNFPAGIAWVLVLGILLLLSALPARAWRGSRRQLWILLSVAGLIGFVGVGLRYQTLFEQLVYRIPPNFPADSQTAQIGGTEALTPQIDAMLRRDGAAEVVFNSQSDPHRVWTAPSLAEAPEVLTRWYVALVALAALMAFSLLELIAISAGGLPAADVAPEAQPVADGASASHVTAAEGVPARTRPVG